MLFHQSFFIHIDYSLYYSGKLDLSISLRLPDWCRMFQVEVLVIYRAAQWILVTSTPFALVSIFSDSQATIRFLSGFVNNSKFVKECRRCLDLLSGRFCASLVWFPGQVLGNYRAHGLLRAGAPFPKSSSIELGMPLASFKLAIARKFFQDSNLSWVNKESCSIDRLT